MNKRISKGNFAEHNAKMIAKNPKIVIYSRCGGIFRMEKRKVVLYCRVASVTENSDIIDVQEGALKKYADMHDYEITDKCKIDAILPNVITNLHFLR